VSVATAAEARAAAEAGADYLSASPVFGTATKNDLARPVGLEGIAAIREACPCMPLVAIGGMNAARASEVLAAGADGLAFVSPLGEDPESNVRRIALSVDAALGGSR
jgi:thiamine-phosphate pyrophosphorylase